jgi:ABC-type antimicrobial peptide transport system permease subunit
MQGIADAMALGIVGIYGAVSCTLLQRRRENGICWALGAQSTDVLHMVLGQSAKMALVSMAIGIAAALVLTDLLRSRLSGESPHDTH